MAGSILTQTLVRFANSEVEGFEQPFNFTAGTVKWSVASDRKCLVAARGWGPYRPPQWNATTHTQRTEDVTRLLTSAVPEKASSVPLEELAAWANQPAEGDAVLGLALGVPVNIRKLAHILEGLPFKTIFVWDASKAADMPCLGLAVGGGSWRAYLAGFPLDEDGPDVDAFDPQAQQALFDLALGV